VLPSSKELWVVKPPTAIVDDPPVKRVLAYPIELRYSDALRPGGLDPIPPRPVEGMMMMTLQGAGGASTLPPHRLFLV
jgi:hypothetical protein